MCSIDNGAQACSSSTYTLPQAYTAIEHDIQVFHLLLMCSCAVMLVALVLCAYSAVPRPHQPCAEHQKGILHV